MNWEYRVPPALAALDVFEGVGACNCHLGKIVGYSA